MDGEPPKGAQLTHANLIFQADALARNFKLRLEDYEVLCYLPLCHLAEKLRSQTVHLRMGGVVDFAESIDTVQANVREIAPTIFLGVPRRDPPSRPRPRQGWEIGDGTSQIAKLVIASARSGNRRGSAV